MRLPAMDGHTLKRKAQSRGICKSAPPPGTLGIPISRQYRHLAFDAGVILALLRLAYTHRDRMTGSIVEYVKSSWSKCHFCGTVNADSHYTFSHCPQSGVL